MVAWLVGWLRDSSVNFGWFVGCWQLVGWLLGLLVDGVVAWLRDFFVAWISVNENQQADDPGTQLM